MLKKDDRVRVIKILGQFWQNSEIAKTINKEGTIIQAGSSPAIYRVLFEPEGVAFTYFEEEIEKV